MIVHTEAYKQLRVQAQDYLNFVTVCCYAVPSMKMQAKIIENGLAGPDLPRPDYFKGKQKPPGELVTLAQDYKRKLANVTIITLFSYFEAYVIDAIKEMIAFHGGESKLIERAHARVVAFQKPLPQNLHEHKRRLSEYNKPGYHSRYMTSLRVLSEAGYRFPSELLSSYGVRMLVQKIGNLKASGIPDLLMQGLGMDLSESQIKNFNDMRDVRNLIAHGRGSSKSLPEALRFNQNMRSLALEVDNHIVKNFFIIESI